MDTESHWENVYGTNAPDKVSWFRLHLDTSLALIERAGVNLSSSIIDVGGGESTLIDDLLIRGYSNLTVLDISEKALGVTRSRLGEAAQKVQWIVADITQANLPPGLLFVGAGLLFAGLTEFCLMATFLGRMPWNRMTAQNSRTAVCKEA